MIHLPRILPLFIAWLLVFCPQAVFASASPNEAYNAGIDLLAAKDFSQKEEGIKRLAASGDPRAADTLEAVLQGRLYFSKIDRTLIQAEIKGSTATITDFLTGEDLGKIKKRKLNKITINNNIRGLIKSTLANLNLSHPNADMRLEAVNAVLSSITPELQEHLKEILKTEQDEKVREALSTAVALGGLRNPEPANRLNALEEVRGSLNPFIKNEIVSLLEKESDYKVQKKAEKILAEIESAIAWYSRLETLFFGMSMGSVLVLAAIGLAITFGVIGVINMAHGELIMIGAYTTYVIQQLMPDSIALALIISIPAAFLVSGLIGIVIEKSVIRFLYGRPLETLLATFGISLVLQQAVRSIFSPLNRSVSTPDWMSGSLVINPVLSVTTNRVVIFIFAMAVFCLLYLALKKSSLGLHVRAVSQNRAMARAMGVRAARVDALTFGLGSGIAGIAGVALSQLTNVGPNLGQGYIIDSFMVVVFGGVGNLWGTMLGGLSLGIANKFLEPWSGAVLAKIIILVFIILFIQKRPQGLFPQKGRAAE